MSHTLTSPHFAYAAPADTIDTAYLGAIHSCAPYFNTDPTTTPEATATPDFLTCLLISVGILILIWAIFRLRLLYRLYRDPAYRDKYRSDQAYLKRRAADMRKIKQQQRQEARLRRQRALDNMTPTERLLYQQNKTLNYLYWLTFFRGLSNRRR